MICLVCEREILDDPGEEEWRGKGPVDPLVCAGCWVSWIEIERFLIRSGRRPPFTLKVFELMKEFLAKFSKEYE